jgi:FKBP-type peptidyl-prolyl cis-trans isomerase
MIDKPIPFLKLSPAPITFSLLIALSFSSVASEDSVLNNFTTRSDSDGIPAILNYVQQQGVQNPVAEPENTPKPADVIRPLRAKVNNQQAQITEKNETIRRLQAQLEQQKKQAEANTLTANNEKSLRVSLQQMQEKIAALTAEKDRSLDDQKQLTLQLSALKNQSRGDEKLLQSKEDDFTRLNEQLKKTQRASAEQQAQMASTAGELMRTSKQLEELQQKLQSIDQDKQQVATQYDEKLKKLQQELETQKTRLVNKENDFTLLKSESEQEKTELTGKAAEIEKLTAQLAELKTEAEEKIIKPELKGPELQQAYSIGVSMGQDVLEELMTHEAQGSKMDRLTVLRGIEDLFSGHLELDETTRARAVKDASKALYENMHNIERKAISEGKTYQQKFAKQKGVEFKDGVYSRIDYKGQEAIKPEDTVTVVLKETLPDGTVINDMEASGKIWSQPLSAYPPIFKGPLARLGNHGSITIVVPPDLAYGSKGLPPKIPPGATMIYKVRIVDVKK